jgi:hypothetical protein
MRPTRQVAHLGEGQQQSPLDLSDDAPVPLTFALRKYNLVAVRISFRLNARIFELFDPIIEVRFDERHGRSPRELFVLVDLQPASNFELPFPW